MKNKIILTLQLYKGFLDKADPNAVILYIHNNVYGLLKEMKYLPHTGAYEEFHDDISRAYLAYYREVIEPKNENWLYFLFPDPAISYYTWRYFSFKKFYIGLTCRIAFGSSIFYYYYNDPINWTIGYTIGYDKERVNVYNCQYILLENYNEFEIIESIGSEQLANYRYICYKKANRYPGQRVPELEETGKYEVNREYSKIENKSYLEDAKKFFDRCSNPKILEVWREISKNRPQDWYSRVRPMWSLEEELRKKVKPLLEEEEAEMRKKLDQWKNGNK